MIKSDIIIVTPTDKTKDATNMMTREDIISLAHQLVGSVHNKSKTDLYAKYAFATLFPSHFIVNSLTKKLLDATLGTRLSYDPQVLGLAIAEQEELVEVLLRSILERETLLRNSLMGLNLIEVGSAELEQLRFSISKPLEWTAYKPHPYDAQFYVPVASFHDFMLHDKKAEFLRIAAALGAKRVQVLESDVSSSDLSMEGSVSAGVKAAKTNLNVKNEKAQVFSLDFNNDSIPSQMPYLPQELRWIAGDPLWQAMVDTRLNHFATEFRVGFQYTSDFGLDANIAAGLKGIGLSIGGNYQSQLRVRQEYLVEFWPRNAYHGLNT